jgi:Bacteriodetes cell division protein (FtsL-like)
MNREKKSTVQNAAPAKELKRPAAPGKLISYLNSFGIFSKDMLMKVMPYIFFLTLIALVYIANSYYAERTIRDIDAVSKELKTLRTEYITGKSELMIVSKQSEVARAVAPQGLKEPVEAPKKIVVQPKTEKSSD